MKKIAFAALVPSALVALTVATAAPAVAAPSGPGDGNDRDRVAVDNTGYPQGGQTPYGTYQNDDSRPGGRR